MALPDMPTLETLLALMQAGDLRALDHLVRAYGTRLMAVARRRCQLPGDVEDAVQQALLAASTSMTTFRGDGSPLAWLSTLVARSCYRLNEHVDTDGAHGDLTDDVPCGCEDPHATAERRELSLRLGAALMTLPRVDRLAFVLAAEGFTSVEIAARFDLSHDAVRSRLKRARKLLRAQLDDTPRGLARTPGHADPSDRSLELDARPLLSPSRHR